MGEHFNPFRFSRKIELYSTKRITMKRFTDKKCSHANTSFINLITNNTNPTSLHQSKHQLSKWKHAMNGINCDYRYHPGSFYPKICERNAMTNHYLSNALNQIKPSMDWSNSESINCKNQRKSL